MLFTNTYTTYLIFPVYLIYTEFEHLIMYCCCRPRLTSLFSYEGSSTSGFSEGGFAKIDPPPQFFFCFFGGRGVWFFFFFFVCLFFCWVLGLVHTFFSLQGGVVVQPGWFVQPTWVVITAGFTRWYQYSMKYNSSVMWGDEFSLFLCKKTRILDPGHPVAFKL